MDKGLELRVAGLDQLPPRLIADHARLRQILVNLIGNAVKFTHHGSVTLTLTAEPPTSPNPPEHVRLRIRVDDSGIGIAPEHQARLFDRFYRGDPAQARVYGGAGLGLTISRELVEAMSGQIFLESEVGRGSSFWFELTLPIAPALEPESFDLDATATQSGPRPAVLLVEDNPINQRIAARLLQRAGVDVTIASNGLAAVRQFADRPFDAVFMDCQMPEMDGWQAARFIRRHENGQSRTPIIALTAAAMKGERERCLDAGMDDYLTKPLDLAQLQRALSQWLPAAGPVQSSPPRPEEHPANAS
jgi:CheY-like chemotaxis protein